VINDDPPQKPAFKPKKAPPGAYLLVGVAGAGISLFSRKLGLWIAGLAVVGLLLFGLWAFFVITRHRLRLRSK
jgi:hypothetical protein